MTSDTTAMDMLREKYDQLFSAEKKVVDTIRARVYIESTTKCVLKEVEE